MKISVYALTVIVVSVLGLGSVAFAEEEKPKKAVVFTEQGPVGLVKEPVIHQTGIDAGIAYSPLSDHMLRYGANVHWIVSPQWHVGATILSGEDPYYSWVGGAENEATLDGQMWLIRGRYFTSKTFYVSGGLGQRNATVDYKATDGDLQVNGKLKMDATVASLGVGHHWQTKAGFTLTIDWLSYAHPLQHSFEEVEQGRPGSVPLMVAQANMIEMGEELSSSGGLTFAQTTFGWRF